VDDAVLVRERHAPHGLERHAHGAQRVDGRALQHVFERLADEQLHGDERDVVVHAEVGDVHHVRVLQLGERARLTLEAPLERADVPEVVVEHLDGERAAPVGGVA
jgi:hypothetical protein